jgi:hypothetical protein
MRRTFRTVLAASLLIAPVLFACGDDRMERGLALPEEPAVPESDQQMGMTEAERDAEVVEQDKDDTE